MRRTDIEFESDKKEFSILLDKTLKVADKYEITDRLVIKDSSRDLLMDYLTRCYLEPHQSYTVGQITELENLRGNALKEYFKKGKADD